MIWPLFLIFISHQEGNVRNFHYICKLKKSN